MYIVDYHHHTNHSFDSKAVMNEVCTEAIHRNINEICFTEHYSLNPLAPTYGHINLKRYIKDIEQCRAQFEGKLVIKAGIEICEPHLLKSEYQKVLEPLQLDFILGSVHNINDKKLRLYLQHKTVEEVYGGYFEELYNLVKHADIDVLAHIDLMKRYAIKVHGNYDFDQFKPQLKDILTKAIERNIGIEINTSGMRSSLAEPLPSQAVLKLYKELGGELLTVGSDSHKVETVGDHISEAIALAKECGFRYVFTYDKRQPSAISI